MADKTAEVIELMLKECTGTHFLDSGGHREPAKDEDGKSLYYDDGTPVLVTRDGYGRHWEQNQRRDFASEKPTRLSLRYGDISVTHNLYHWLVDRVEYDPEMDERFQKFADLPDNEDLWGASIMEEFTNSLSNAAIDVDECDWDKVSGLYGEGYPFTVNTYNGEDLLSQVLLYRYFTYKGEAYVILSIHNGADVRGGYTRPKVFNVSGRFDETAILCNTDATIMCTSPECEANWRTDDGYHWYRDGCAGWGAKTQLEVYDRQEVEEAVSFWHRILRKLRLEETPDYTGILRYDDEGNGYCPVCVTGQLEAMA